MGVIQSIYRPRFGSWSRDKIRAVVRDSLDLFCGAVRAKFLRWERKEKLFVEARGQERFDCVEFSIVGDDEFEWTWWVKGSSISGKIPNRSSEGEVTWWVFHRVTHYVAYALEARISWDCGGGFILPDLEKWDSYLGSFRRYAEFLRGRSQRNYDPYLFALLRAAWRRCPAELRLPARRRSMQDVGARFVQGDVEDRRTRRDARWYVEKLKQEKRLEAACVCP